MSSKGKLYLIPCTLGNQKTSWSIPFPISDLINSINTYITENERTARRYLKSLGIKTAIDDLTLLPLNKHTTELEWQNYLNHCLKGQDIGLLSEAGCPAIADPGKEIVKIAHKNNIQIIPLVGPSSILLSLMASGLNGQNFSFNGYLPIEKTERIKKIKELEVLAEQKQQTQIFIEAPYRNQKLLTDLLSTLKNNSNLCIACDITLPTEFIQTKDVSNWKRNIPAINKRPTVFLIG